MTPERIRTYRKLLGISTRAAAELCKVSQRTFQAYETGFRRVPDDIAATIKMAVDEQRDVIIDLLNSTRT